jgi:hypothetical protein
VQQLQSLRRLAAQLASDGEEAAEPEVEPEQQTEPEPESDASEPEETAAEAEPEEIDYSLFVPGPNGYELIPQTGVPPKTGQTVELILPNGEEPILFEVVRSGRTLPDGDVCVYLAQV